MILMSCWRFMRMHARSWLAAETRHSGERPDRHRNRCGRAFVRCVSFVCEENGRIAAAFEFSDGPDPTYLVIREGAWVNESAPYRVIHKLASYGNGAGRFCLDWCWSQFRNLRIDTHRDNIPMQALLKKCGFVYCGLIDTLHDGERLAYQKIAD